MPPAATRTPPQPAAAAAFDLSPGPGLTPVADAAPGTWRADDPQVRFAADVPLAPGWYRVLFKLRAADRFTVRKKGELVAEFDGGHPPELRLEGFEWNRGLSEDFFVHLPRPTARLRLTLQHAEGVFSIDRFEVRPVGPVRAMARAVRMKLHLLAAYQNFWPVAFKGGKLLLTGKLSEFRRKMMKGLTDARTLRLEARQASEVDAALWRRQTLPAGRIAAVKAGVERMTDPPPLAVLLPVDPSAAEQARMAVHSVLRQLYPHWQLVVAWPTDPVPDALTAAARGDSRVRFVTAGTGGLGDAVRRALAALPCDRVFVLPPDWELREHALFRLAERVKDANGAAAVTCDMPAALAVADTDPAGDRPGIVARAIRRHKPRAGEPPAARPGADAEPEPPPPDFRLGVLPAAAVREAAGLAEQPTAAEVVEWAGGLLPPDGTSPHVDEVLATPLDGGSLMTRCGVKPLAASGPPLFLAGDILRISGYDHLVFAVLKGLMSRGANVRRHPITMIRGDLVPPALRPPVGWRSPGHAQLAVTPPFLLWRFKPDARTAAYTMWETDSLDPESVKQLNRCGLVVVPSRWGADTFRANGVTVPIEVVPLGYDPLTFHPGPGFPTDCVFGTAGALDQGGLRKNVPRVVELFRRAFPTEPDVRLRVKITPNSPMVETFADPRIDVIQGLLPHADLAGWYRSLTAYVNLSFAEGFGLHLVEAMACGRPLISTAYSGVGEFFDGRVGYEVPYAVVGAKNEIYAGRWADPDDDAVVAAMRRVYADREEAKRLGERAAARARRFTWRDAGRQLEAVLTRYGFLDRTKTD